MVFGSTKKIFLIAANRWRIKTSQNFNSEIVILNDAVINTDGWITDY